jgi:hypothetical protein
MAVYRAGVCGCRLFPLAGNRCGDCLSCLTPRVGCSLFCFLLLRVDEWVLWFTFQDRTLLSSWRIFGHRLRIESDLRTHQSALADIYLALPPALVAFCLVFFSVHFLGLFTPVREIFYFFSFFLIFAEFCTTNPACF